MRARNRAKEANQINYIISCNFLNFDEMLHLIAQNFGHKVLIKAISSNLTFKVNWYACIQSRLMVCIILQFPCIWGRGVCERHALRDLKNQPHWNISHAKTSTTPKLQQCWPERPASLASIVITNAADIETANTANKF